MEFCKTISCCAALGYEGIACRYPRRLFSGILISGFMAASAQAAFQPLETFDALTLGNINGQNTWVDAGNSGQVVLDPDGGLNQVLAVDTESGVLHRDAVVSQGASRMLFLRFRFEDHGRYSFGLSRLSNPTEYSDFGPELGMAESSAGNLNNDFRVANGNTLGIYDVLETLAPDTWYNTWVMMDNLNDDYQVWLNAVPGGSADAGDQLDNDAGESVFGFRTSGSADLIKFFIKTGGGNSPVQGQFFLDDIYLENTSALNLTNPTVVPLPPALALFASALVPLLSVAGSARRRRTKGRL